VDNVDLIRRATQAQAEGDLGPARELIAGDAAIHVPDALEQGDLRGIDGLVTLILDLLGRSEGTFASSLIDAIGTGDIVTTINQVTATCHGQTLSYNTVWTFRFDGNQVVEAWLHPSRPEGEIARFYGFGG
jgi:predicted SnoaL-like aldol condensation-catalyzing enzyme